MSAAATPHARNRVLPRRTFLRMAAGVGAWPLLAGVARAMGTRPTAAAKPNIIVILSDDLGYTDLGCYGATKIKTPWLDRMAREGTRLTDFYAAAPVCTPTRAALLTGCYPKRVDLHIGVLGEKGNRGLNPNEVTLAELLRGQGYATACIGKWHLGTLPEVFPTRQGFDYYFGMPGPNHGASDLYRNETLLVKKAEVNRAQLTQQYTAEALEFITRSKDKPFFLYLAHGAPHVPLYASERFRGKSAAGLLGDMIEELDWSCGQVLEALKQQGLDERTLVIFTSDNGPADHAAPPLHGGKGSTWEGGFRVPCLARWPGHVPAGGVTHGLATMMDLLPTLAPLAGARTPSDRVIDGMNILPLLTNPSDAASPRATFFYYSREGILSAVRSGNWKLHVVAPVEKWAGKLPAEALLDAKPATPPPWLFDLAADISETRNVAAEHPAVVKRLQDMIAAFDKAITAEVRPAYQAPKPAPAPAGTNNAERRATP